MGIVRTDENTIDGITYQSTVFTATQGLSIFAKLSLVFGELVPIFFGDNAKGGVSKDADGKLSIDKAAIGLVMAQLSTTLIKAEKELGENPLLVLRDLLVGTTSNQVQISDDATGKGSLHTHFDSHFARNYVHLIKVCFWVGSLNFITPSGAKG